MNKLTTVIVASVVIAVTFGVVPVVPGIGSEPAYAAEKQSAADKKRAERKRKTRRVPTISEQTYRKLSEVQEAIDVEDLNLALEVLNDITKRRSRYNANELGQIHNMYAYVYFNQENYAQAIKHYEQVVAQGDGVPQGLEIATLYSLAQLNFIEEQYRESLRYMQLWLTKADNPGPEPHIFMGQVYYQMEDYGSAIVQIETGIQVAQDRDRAVKENWWQLLRYLYFESEDWDKVLDILEILVRDFPKREYWMQLAGVYGQQEMDREQMLAMETAHVGKFLTRESDLLTYAGLLMQEEIPYRAAKWLEQGFDDGTIEDTSKNLQALGQAWQLAQEVDKAIPVFEKAGSKSDDGEILARLASLYLEADEFVKCSNAADRAIKKGGLKKAYNTQMVQGMCLFNRDRLTAARSVFVDARNASRRSENKSVQRMCQQWITYIDRERSRRAQLEAAIGE
ncbi:MAG: tetratricopeptide repeat protein [Gammaproteobacteria bacterium]|nr:tetratricopeptide repeat protein [Gammaproteobacteria bacterium]